MEGPPEEASSDDEMPLVQAIGREGAEAAKVQAGASGTAVSDVGGGVGPSSGAGDAGVAAPAPAFADAAAVPTAADQSQPPQEEEQQQQPGEDPAPPTGQQPAEAAPQTVTAAVERKRSLRRTVHKPDTYSPGRAEAAAAQRATVPAAKARRRPPAQQAQPQDAAGGEEGDAGEGDATARKSAEPSSPVRRIGSGRRSGAAARNSETPPVLAGGGDGQVPGTAGRSSRRTARVTMKKQRLAGDEEDGGNDEREEGDEETEEGEAEAEGGSQQPSRKSKRQRSEEPGDAPKEQQEVRHQPKRTRAAAATTAPAPQRPSRRSGAAQQQQEQPVVKQEQKPQPPQPRPPPVPFVDVSKLPAEQRPYAAAYQQLQPTYDKLRGMYTALKQAIANNTRARQQVRSEASPLLPDVLSVLGPLAELPSPAEPPYGGPGGALVNQLRSLMNMSKMEPLGEGADEAVARLSARWGLTQQQQQQQQQHAKKEPSHQQQQQQGLASREIGASLDEPAQGAATNAAARTPMAAAAAAAPPPPADHGQQQQLQQAAPDPLAAFRESYATIFPLHPLGDATRDAAVARLAAHLLPPCAVHPLEAAAAAERAVFEAHGRDATAPGYLAHLGAICAVLGGDPPGGAAPVGADGAAISREEHERLGDEARWAVLDGVVPAEQLVARTRPAGPARGGGGGDGGH